MWKHFLTLFCNCFGTPDQTGLVFQNSCKKVLRNVFICSTLVIKIKYSYFDYMIKARNNIKCWILLKQENTANMCKYFK